MTLEKFTRSLDAKSLPRVLQIQSGYYFQGKTEDIISPNFTHWTGILD